MVRLLGRMSDLRCLAMLTVGEVMTRDPVTIGMDHSLKAIREISTTRASIICS